MKSAFNLRLLIFCLICSGISNASFATVRTWNGGGGDNNWTTGANWGGTAPVAGDDLVFGGAVRPTPNNDFAAGTNFNSISFSAGASAFTLSGNSVTIVGGASAITASNISLTMTIGLNIIFSTSAPTITTTSGGTLIISGTITNGGLLTSTTCNGSLTLSGIISGIGGFAKNGVGTCTFSANNTMTGTTTISAGTLDMSGSNGNVAGNIVNNAALVLSETGSITINSTISGTGTITSTASNITVVGNNTYTGLTILTSNKVNITTNTLGAISGGTVINGSSSLILYSTYTYPAEPLTINSTGFLRTSLNGIADLVNYTGNITLGSSTTGFRAFESNDILTISGAISGAFNANFNSGGLGTIALSGINTYSGTTDLFSGTLQLLASGVIPDASNFVASGGTFSTGAVTGFSETMGTLTLTGNATIALGTGSHSLNFAASNGTAWTGGQMLGITGWQGGYNCTSGTSGQIYTGASAELSAAKLAQIFFVNPGNGISYTACQLANGEIVPSAVPLPVTLVSFTGEKVKNTNELYWSTASEINSKYYEILRSSDGINFESIGKVNAAGNSASFSTYVFVDYAPTNGMNYYKLAQYDFDGSYETSTIIAISNNGESSFKINALYPNPASDYVTVNFEGDAAGKYYINIYDEPGKELTTVIMEGVVGENQFKLLIDNYSNGKYFVRIINPKKESIVSKVILQQ